MNYKRQHFLFSAAGAAIAANSLDGQEKSASAAASAKLTPKVQDPKRRLDIALFSHVEDIFNPPEFGNDESIKELAVILRGRTAPLRSE